MKLARHAFIVYRKELVDILRDRRTLLAMVVIPVVLYPVLMVWVVGTAELGQARLEAETFVIQVPDEPTRQTLRHVLETVARDKTAEQSPQPAFKIRVGHADPSTWGETIQLGVKLTVVEHAAPLPPGLRATVWYNDVDFRSRAALDRLTAELDAFRKMLARQTVHALWESHLAAHGNLPGTSAKEEKEANPVDLILEPVAVQARPTATELQRGGWILGQVVPIVLVLMTLTGAVYPAIDLTAGERERGTLEALMVTPAPTLHVITGKFLVVATIALLSAVLNLASVAAAMHFAGITRLMAAERPVVFPIRTLPVILLCMVPLALMFAAGLLAVCSVARTFREAQNYVMPVILACLAASAPVMWPGVELDGVMVVLPVGNMVLLVRALFAQTACWPEAVSVVLTTCLYTAAAVALAARLFGKEAVLFADAGAYRALLCRRVFQRQSFPNAAQALVYAALLFPACFYVQSALFETSQQDVLRHLTILAVVQFGGLFVAGPLALCGYLKIEIRSAFRLRLPARRVWLAAAALGSSSWVLAHEWALWQAHVLPLSKATQETLQRIADELAAAPPATVIVLAALVPAVAEEMLFRGFLLSGLKTALGRSGAILAAALVFSLFHFMVGRMPLTFLLGVVLGWLCLRSGSILPGMAVHALHNTFALIFARWEATGRWLGGPWAEAGGTEHLPLGVVTAALCLFLCGVVILCTCRDGCARKSSG